MKNLKTLTLLCWIALLACGSFSGLSAGNPPIPFDPHLKWQKFLGAEGNQYLSAVHPLTKGGFVCLAYSDPYTKKSLVKNWAFVIDNQGKILGEKWATETVNSFFTNIHPSDDGGWLLSGSFLSDYGAGKNSLDIRINKFDAKGKPLWERYLGGSQRDFFLSLLPTPDGGCLVLGEVFSVDGLTKEDPHQPGDLWLVKLSAEGQIQGETFLSNRSPYFRDAAKALMDGECLKAPAAIRYPQNLLAFGKKLSKAANQICRVLETHKDLLMVEHLDLVVTPRPKQGGYWLSWSTWKPYQEKPLPEKGRSLQSWAACLDFDLALLWEKPLKAGDRYLIWAISSTPDDGFLAVGTVTRRGTWLHQDDQPEAPHRGLIVKFNSQGEPEWHKIPLSQNQGELFFLFPSGGDNYLAAGEGSSKLHPNLSRVWILGVR